MNLVSEIVAKLSDQNESLAGALLKTKVLLYQIGHKELADLVNKELNGYDAQDVLPPYRIIRGQVKAHLASIAYTAENHPIPLGHLDKDYRSSLENVRMMQSLSVVETLAHKDRGSLRLPIPMEANRLLGKSLTSDWRIQSAWIEVQFHDVENIPFQVRTRMLDFMLQVQGGLGDSDDKQEIEAKGKGIDAVGMFANAVFGSNTTIVVGHGNTVSVVNAVVKGDFAALSSALKQLGVADEDIASLKTSIESDAEREQTASEIGPAVKSWLGTMWSKAVETSWAIEMGIAGNLLTDLLKKFYGWG